MIVMMMLAMVVIIMILVLIIERKAIMTNEYRPSRYVSRVAIDRATVLSLEPTIDISHIWDEELNLENRITGENFFIGPESDHAMLVTHSLTNSLRNV